MTERLGSRCKMIRLFCALLLSSLAGNWIAAQEHQPPRLVERLCFDWDHSGTPTRFSLYSRTGKYGDQGDSDRLVIVAMNRKPWILLNNDDEWGPFVIDDLAIPRRKNLVGSKRLFFLSAGQAADARIYLILKGGGYGCCVGSLWVLTQGADGAPKLVFHATEHLLQDILPLSEGSGIVLVGQPSDAEARTLKNAESYDPYRVYVLDSDHPARYDLDRSKAYTIEHYCDWAGPKYDEHYIAVSVVPGQFGAGKCRTMTGAQFGAYMQKYPSQFPQ